jgi:hypothetical protein
MGRTTSPVRKADDETDRLRRRCGDPPFARTQQPPAGPGVIARTHGIALAALLGAASVAGAYATITTAKLGDSETKPEVVASAEIAKRRARLDEWEASLRKALATKPPALPAIPRYARAGLVSTPSYAGLPALTPARTTTTAAAAPTRVSRPAPRTTRTSPSPARSRPADTERRRTAPGTTRAKAATPEPVAQAPTTTAAPAEAPPPPAAAPAPAPAPPATTAPTPQPATTTLSKRDAEKQCEALKRAAEGQGEAAKKDAERRCEELKKAAEGDD